MQDGCECPAELSTAKKKKKTYLLSIVKNILSYILLENDIEYLESTMLTLIYDILICYNGLVRTTNKYSAFNTTLVCSVMDKQCNLLCPKVNISNKMWTNVSFLYFP